MMIRIRQVNPVLYASIIPALFMVLVYLPQSINNNNGTVGRAALPAPTVEQQNAPPNIILILADDLGADDIGCEGTTYIKTPNIDRIAHEGMRFTHAFLTASSCSPSRASIITGRYPHNTGCPDLATGPVANFPHFFEKVEFFPEILHGRGYWTGHYGKWHIGGTNWNKPSGAPLRGFDHAESMPDKQVPFGGEQGWISLLDKAQQTKKPFYLYLAPYDPHYPYEFSLGPDSVSEQVKPSDVKLLPYMSKVPQKSRDSVKKHMAKYFNAIRRLDNGVGRLLAALDARGLANNTMIIFMSDNGHPFPRSKTTLYDSGMRTPMLVRWPAQIKAGQVNDDLLSSIDVAPTILDAAGCLDKAKTLMGRSFMPTLKNGTATAHEWLAGERNWHLMAEHERMIRLNNFLYIRNNHPNLPRFSDGDDGARPPFAAEEFYDCGRDPFQLTNLINDKTVAPYVAKCRQLLAQWTKDTGDTVPADYTPTWPKDQRDPNYGKYGTQPGIPNFGLDK